MKKFVLLLVFLVGVIGGCQARKIKVACVGNSVTYGYLIENRSRDAYPSQLQRMLGEEYEVVNFGHSGATLLRHGHRPYNTLPEYDAALKYAADVVVIHLGLNDTDPRDWPNYRDEFLGDYLSLIGDFRAANPQSRIFICRLTPIFHAHPRFKSGTRDWFWMIQSEIEKVAKVADVELIDLHTPLYSRPDLFPDALHPNAEGTGILAKTVCQSLTGDFGGLQLSPMYSDNMVLQRERELLISGRADRGEEVTVTFAREKHQTVADDYGRWSVTLAPMKADGKSHTLKIATRRRALTFRNVAVGEVWLCSGQSNMAFRVNESVESEQVAERDYAARSPQIRLYNMKPCRATNNEKWSREVLDSVNALHYFRPSRWETVNPENAAEFSAIAFAFGRTLADSLKVPVGLVLNAVGGSCTESWIDRKTMEFEFSDLLMDWSANDFVQEWARGRADLNTALRSNALQRHPYHTCYLYEAGILPVKDYTFSGVIWYQGESNAHNIETHEKLFPLLVKSWRKTFGEQLPFYYVQLSSLNRPSWCWFRDSQRRMMGEIPHCGMAVSSDLGNRDNVHPTQKMAVGERLARWALVRDFGWGCLPSGPLCRTAERTGKYAFVSFDCGEQMRSADGEALRTFEVAGKEGIFYPARAEVDGNRVKVWADEVDTPCRVRYGWQPYTTANLINRDGLPASTFQCEVE